MLPPKKLSKMKRLMRDKKLDDRLNRLAKSTAALNEQASRKLVNRVEVSTYNSSEAQELYKKIEAMISTEPDAETVLRARKLRDEGYFHRKPSHRAPMDLNFDKLILECGHGSLTKKAGGPDTTDPFLCHECANEWMRSETKRKKST